MGSHVHDQLGAFLDGALSGTEEKSVRDHVAVCGDCRSELESLQSLDADVSADLENLLTPAPDPRRG